MKLQFASGATLFFPDTDSKIVARLERDENAFVRFLVDKIRQEILDDQAAAMVLADAPQLGHAPRAESASTVTGA